MEPAASTDVLSLAESRKLLQYVWSGVLLPTDLDNFNRRIGRKGDDHRLDEMIRDLLVTYQRIKSHCGLFKDTTYPNIINLASLIYDYSQTAGGEEDDSYYANILSAGKLLYEEKQKAKPDQKVIDEQSGIMKDLIDAQIEAIEKLRTEAQRVTTSLSDFETECKGDELELKGKIAPIDNQLNGEGGKVKQLQDDIAAKKKQIQADEEERQQGKSTILLPLQAPGVIQRNRIVVKLTDRRHHHCHHDVDLHLDLSGRYYRCRSHDGHLFRQGNQDGQ